VDEEAQGLRCLSVLVVMQASASGSLAQANLERTLPIHARLHHPNVIGLKRVRLCFLRDSFFETAFFETASLRQLLGTV
jgi:hypothetical protein